MASVDTTLYSASIVIVIASIYFLKYFHAESFLSKTLSKFPTWLGGNVGKAGLQRFDPLASPLEECITPQYNSSWWTDEKQFQLERRAIFSKTWMFVTHASRFQKPGDYRTFETAGFSFIVILGKCKQLRAFHNVCRHRAYAVTKKESGSSMVLGCRYHGWSYDTKGKLIKAPEFENVAGFDKAMNGLWELKTEIRNGMVFVNFEVGSGETELKLGESERLFKRWRISEMKWAHEWKAEGAFNWKHAAENFFAETQKKVEPSSWLSFLPDIFGNDETELTLSCTAIVQRLSSGRVLTLKLLPISTDRTLIECNIYGRNSRHTKATQLELDSMKTNVQLMIQRTELQHQEFIKGNGKKENSSIQEEVKQILDSHRDAEKALGAEIHPAARKQSFTPEGIADDDLCKELEMSSDGRKAACGANSQGLLDW